MKFNRLQASIANNAHESPTLYMALCAVESLFADIEDACGTDLSLCPAGDERLPSKLVWLCRVVNEIYQDHSEDLQRNRSRLDAAMAKLQDAQKQLEDSAEVGQRLSELQADYRALEKKLLASTEAAEECEQLQKACAKAKRQLEELKSFDTLTAEAELRQLQEQIKTQESTQVSLRRQLEQARECVDDIRQEVDRLQEKEMAMRQEYLALKEQEQQLRAENARLRQTQCDLEVEFAAAKEEGQNLVAKRDDIQRKTAMLRDSMEQFRNEDLAAKLAEMQTVQEEMDQLKESRSAFDQEYEHVKSQRNQMILDIAHKKAENESLQEKLNITRQKQQEMEQEALTLNAQMTLCLQELEDMQTEVELLNGKKLPEAQQLRSQEQQRYEELQQRLQQAATMIATYQTEIEKCNARLPKLEEEVKNNRVVYDALTASCAASSSELESLERQIEELRSNTDEQKLMIYRKQLEENQQQLQAVQAECQAIQQQIAQQQEQLDAMQNERARLRELKNRHEQGVEVTRKQLQELEFAASDKYMSEVTALDGQIKLLETVRAKLSASVTNMQKILGHSPVEQPVSLEDQLKQQLWELRLRTDDLRATMVECAQSLKLEER